MLNRAFGFLYSKSSASFQSDLTMHQVVSQLSNATRRWYQFGIGESYALGTVTETRVVLRRVIPFVQNSFKPEFRGAFRSTGKGVVLEGAFSLNPFVRVFLTFWFGFGVLWLVFAAVATATEPNRWLFPLVGVGVLVLGRALVTLGLWFARNDVTWLSRLIEQALAARPNNSSKPTPLRGAA